jgi:two-component system chemotaxis sensor kinase CheA
MSDDFLETIWAQYAIETEEHFESIESLLVKADTDALSSDEVSALFRAFHSLKGLSGVMELSVLESIAHRSEDLLGKVREGSAVLNHHMVDLLLRSLDAIKILCQKAVTDRVDGEKPVALLEELVRAFKTISQGIALSGSDVKPVATAAVSVVEIGHEPITSLSSELVQLRSKQPEGASAPAATLGLDTQNPDAVFLRSIRIGLPILEALASSMASKQDEAEILKLSQDTRDSLHQMIQGAQNLSYAGLAHRLEIILSSIPASGLISQEDTECMADAIGPFLLDLNILGEIKEVNLEGDSLVMVISPTLTELLLKHLNQVEDLLQTPGLPTRREGKAIRYLLMQLFLKIHGDLAVLYPREHTLIPLLLVDTLACTGRKNQGIDHEVMAFCSDALQLIRIFFGTHKSLHQKSQYEADLKAADDQLQQRIRNYLLAFDAAEGHDADTSFDTSIDTVRQVVSALNIPPALAELLSPDLKRELVQLIHGGASAYLIKAHLESSEEMATTFLEWVDANGRVITNRTLIEDNRSWYEMLFVSKLPWAVIESTLSKLDQGAGCLLFLSQLRNDLNEPKALQLSAAKPASPVLVPTLLPSQLVANVTEAHKPAKQATGNAPLNVIRVPGEMLDQFMNQIGEMVLVRGQLSHIIGDSRVREGLQRLRHHQEDPESLPQGLLVDLQYLSEIMDDQLRRLQATDALIQGTLSRFQESVMGLRVVPVELVFKRFPRMVRDLALAQGKKILLELIGQEVKIDKAMVESLADPLLHMVRNSVDHGVEAPDDRLKAGKPDEAIICIQAEQQGSRIIIRVRDDGKGIDPERIRRKAIERGLVKEIDSLQMSKEEILNFIFKPAFSTADVVTETSGRGVGMDVVWTSVMRLGGTIHLDSEVGRGTTFTLQMPLSAAVQEVLLVKSAQQTLAIPGRYVAELVEIESEAYQTVQGRTAILLRGNFLPIVRLEALLGYPAAETSSQACVVVISDGQRSLGVSVQAFVGRQELFTKDIHPRLAALPGVGGASILGDGRVVLILDATALFRLAENLPPPHRMPLTA